MTNDGVICDDKATTRIWVNAISLFVECLFNCGDLRDQFLPSVFSFIHTSSVVASISLHTECQRHDRKDGRRKASRHGVSPAWQNRFEGLSDLTGWMVDLWVSELNVIW